MDAIWLAGDREVHRGGRDVAADEERIAVITGVRSVPRHWFCTMTSISADEAVPATASSRLVASDDVHDLVLPSIAVSFRPHCAWRAPPAFVVQSAVRDFT
jgi:hypothetical protein